MPISAWYSCGKFYIGLIEHAAAGCGAALDWDGEKLQGDAHAFSVREAAGVRPPPALGNLHGGGAPRLSDGGCVSADAAPGASPD